MANIVCVKGRQFPLGRKMLSLSSCARPLTSSSFVFRWPSGRRWPTASQERTPSPVTPVAWRGGRCMFHSEQITFQWDFQLRQMDVPLWLPLGCGVNSPSDPPLCSFQTLLLHFPSIPDSLPGSLSFPPRLHYLIHPAFLLSSPISSVCVRRGRCLFPVAAVGRSFQKLLFLWVCNNDCTGKLD